MITLDKAIKNLKAGRKDCGMIPEEEFTATIDLATEGLKAVKRLRVMFGFQADAKLPGEKKEPSRG